MNNTVQRRQRAVQRETVWGPESAFVRVNRDAEMKSFTPKGENNPAHYLECMKAVAGGFIPLYVFGENLEELRGKLVPASVELRTKREQRGPEIHYLRAEILPPMAPRPDVKLYVGSGKDENITLLEDFPRLEGAEELREFVIGFVPATKKAKAA
jgi:hypothetical protein